MPGREMAMTDEQRTVIRYPVLFRDNVQRFIDATQALHFSQGNAITAAAATQIGRIIKGKGEPDAPVQDQLFLGHRVLHCLAVGVEPADTADQIARPLDAGLQGVPKGQRLLLGRRRRGGVAIIVLLPNDAFSAHGQALLQIQPEQKNFAHNAAVVPDDDLEGAVTGDGQRLDQRDAGAPWTRLWLRGGQEGGEGSRQAVQHPMSPRNGNIGGEWHEASLGPTPKDGFLRTSDEMAAVMMGEIARLPTSKEPIQGRVLVRGRARRSGVAPRTPCWRGTAAIRLFLAAMFVCCSRGERGAKQVAIGPDSDSKVMAAPPASSNLSIYGS